jgi:hypothetical protein
MTIGRWTTALLVIAAGLCAGSPSHAQITGKLVNPNVMLVLDSSRSMDWLEGHSTGAVASEVQAQAQCVAADSEAGSDDRTSWQQLLDVMLGSIPPADFHCFVEESKIRPALQFGTVAADISANTSEYTTAPSKHFRGLSCSDPRDGGSRGDWNTQFNQCIGSNDVIAELPGTVTETGHWCQNWIDYDGDGLTDEPEEINYVPASGNDREICYNYHPRSKARLSNGLLERYRTLARFGVMTYDNKPSPAALPPDTLANPHDGLFDYGESRKWDCKRWSGLPSLPGAGCTWNAGARGVSANSVGRLVPITDDMESTNQAVRDVLATTEPLYCSPMGSLLDDVGYYFNNEWRVRPASNSGSDLFYSCRPKLVIFISDGQPNQAFEFPQDYCDANAPVLPADPGETTPQPTTPYSCPWNSSKREVHELRTVLENLLPDSATVDPVYFVVIGFNALDKGAVSCTDPAWDIPTSTCIPSDERCIQIATTETESACTADAFRTPRQFLNELALEGWPESGYLIQPPWRSGLSNLCDDATVGTDNSCGGEEGDGEGNGAIFVNGPDELSAVLDLIMSTLTASTATRTEVVTTDQVGGGYDEEWSAFMSENESGDAVAQYQFNSGFEVIGGKPWRGYLYRQGYSCSDAATTGDAGAPNDQLESFSAWLQNQSDRRIYTVPDSKIASLTYSDDAFLNGQPDGTLEEIGGSSSSLDDCDIGGPTVDSVCDAKTDILALFKKHLYGEDGTGRSEHKLADIYNSSPAILGPPLERINVGSYQEFQSRPYSTGGSTAKTQAQRPPLLFTGTNDGVLHSFNVWGTDGDVETWGYVPNAILSGLVRQFPITWTVQNDETTGEATSYTVEENGLYQHIFGVDGSPVAADVRLFRMPNDATSMAEQARYWRSLLVGGLGKGGVGYYALDVTDQQNEPAFRWELSEKASANNDPAVFRSGGQFLFGLPLARPTLTYVYINGAPPIGGGSEVDHEVAVAILPGGYKGDENGGPGTTTGVAIVRAGDGKLIRYLSPAVQADLCSDDPEDITVAQLVGEPAVPYPLRSATVNDEAFLGDDRGRLWRIDMSSKYPSSNGDDRGWCLEMYFDTLLTSHFRYKDCIKGECCDAKDVDVTASCDEGEIAVFAADDDWGAEACTGQPCAYPDYPYPRIPIINAPTIVQDDDRNNIILFGTGQLDGVESLDHHRIFSLTQNINYNVSEGGGGQTQASTEAAAPTINWWLGEPIPPDADITDPDLSAQEAAMFTTRIDFVPTEMTFGSLFNLGEKLLGRIAVFNQVAYFTTFIPALVDGGGAMDACQSGGSRIWGVSFGKNPSATEAWSEASFGKLGGKVFQEFENALLSGVKVVRRPSCSGQAEFQLVSQRANPAATSTGGSGDDSGPPQITSESVTIPQSQRGFTTVAIDSWSLVFN